MTDIALRIENLSKRYRIGVEEPQPKNLQETIGVLVSGSFRYLRQMTRPPTEEETLWALKDVSFEVKRGEVLGIIGRNGAGKSTLLKILSRITEPTAGRAIIQGQVGSLLEVGTGFHPDLTGRENVYLNGTILGMKRRQIDSRIKEIMAFAEIDKFIDTPVKRYSSGMYVRLAFAVAAHLEPDVLIVDEVLAVGDTSFQRKCLGKMNDISKEGRTVLFVSHNLTAMQALCTRVVYMETGRLVDQGDVTTVINSYLNKTQKFLGPDAPLSERVDRQGNGKMHFTGITLQGANDEEIPVAQTGQSITIALDYVSKLEEYMPAVVRIAFADAYNQRVFMCLTRSSYDDVLTLKPQGRLRCVIPKLPLLPGTYTIDIWCKTDERLADEIRSAMEITVVEGDYYGTGRLQPNDSGSILVPHYWEPT
jgi:lipopolysaccharide transport system ATP-binding protein